MVPTEKTKKGMAITNTGVSCKVDIKMRNLLGKRDNKTLKTAGTEIWS
jgi:hypothetical protein